MQNIHNLKVYKNKRKDLRNNLTNAEITLWQFLKNSQLGYKFRRQHGINKYIVDFYCHSLKLIIELDGEVHNHIMQSQKDYLREQELKRFDFKIIRYKNECIIFEIDRVVDHIKRVCIYLDNRKTTPNPSLKRRGVDVR